MMADEPTMPTDEELATANDIMQRQQAARAAEQRRQMAPIVELVNKPEFVTIRQAVEAIPAEFLTNMTVAPHIMALRAGFNGLAGIGAGMAEAPAPMGWSEPPAS